MSTLRKIASFARWRIVPVRYATMVGGMSWNKLFQAPPSRNASTAEIDVSGFAPGPNVPTDLLQEAMRIYNARGRQVVPKETGHPFVNLFSSDDISADNPVFKFAFSPEVLDAAADYFGGRLILDSIQVLYSWPTDGALRESQHWHLDYGDSKSFHCVAYLKDVLTPEDGPFVYVNKAATRKIGRSMIVRRIPDEQFGQELGDGRIEYFYGKAGNSVLVDPSACYHYGSRCKTPRLAIFATFSSWFPFAPPVPLVARNAEKILAAARQVRPDLSESFLKALLQLG
ncbi:hypothetical protein [Herbaspirillum robiniae]|uniref:Phytanoyl-CoA dioxygenase n=1 Tax=Herbaspirillum robiniae TaxID=2014887 RepID=A0ABX2LXI6_9BURK|nr:hypothetical protein [Herbaspirillum robiniae]NUU03199.1 hypothetical protein [Herbaspirillum robiniae]